MSIKFRPQLAMRGGVGLNTPVNLATISLYNNSNSGDMLAVWGVSANEGTSILVGFGAAPGILGAAQGNIQPVITGYPARAGALNYLDDSAALDHSLLFVGQGTQASQHFPPVPLAIIQPGYSCYIQTIIAARALSASFLWQVVHRWDLAGDDCAICLAAG